jgi:hypothetical protein
MKAQNIGNTSTLIAAAGNRDFLHIYNNSDEIIYVKYDGDSDTVTTSNGMPIAVAGVLTLNNDGQRNLFNKPVYGICASGGKEVRVAGDE